MRFYDCRKIDSLEQLQAVLNSTPPLSPPPDDVLTEDDDRSISFEFSEYVTDEWCRSAYMDTAITFQNLNVNHCPNISDDGVIELLKKHGKTLKRLDLYWNVHLTDKAFREIPLHCPNLIYLNLSGCQSLTDKGMDSLFRGNSVLDPAQLRHLDLTRTPKVTDACIRKIMRRCVNLETLLLYANAHLSPLGFGFDKLTKLVTLDICGSQIADSNFVDDVLPPTLKTLNLTWCVHLTDASLKALASKVDGLESLSVFGNLNMTTAGLDALAESRFSTSLHTLDINGCTAIEDRSEEAILRRFPNVKVFQVHS